LGRSPESHWDFPEGHMPFRKDLNDPGLRPSTHRDQALNVGFNEFLTKPIDFDQLDFLIDRFLKAA
jgi:hypothetical protein